MGSKSHAIENLKMFIPIIGKSVAKRFVGKVNATIGGKPRHSIAIVAKITPVANPVREDWAPNDRIVAIWRYGELQTIMLSRKSQINRSHLRVDRII